MHILINSCSSYSDAWSPFFALFAKFWADCPYPVVLLADVAPDVDVMPGLRLRIAPDASWCHNLLRALRDVTTATVLPLQEDFFLCQPVLTAKVAELEEWLRGSDYDCVRLFPCPGADGERITDEIGVVTNRNGCPISCQATIWKTASLIRYLELVTQRRPGRPADFESAGREFIGHFRLASLLRDVPREDWPFSYHATAIVQGKWLRGGLDLCAREGVPVDTSRRGILE